MRDLFDDFMEELRRREAAARGEDPGPVTGRRARPGRPAPGDPEGSPAAPDEVTDETPAAEDDAGDPADEDDRFTPRTPADRTGSPADPSDPIDFGRRRPTRSRTPGRGPGGPNDGGGFRRRMGRAGRTFGLTLGLLIALGLFLLFSVGIDLWTDALWFQSVGFDPVFWTRIGAQGALFVGAFALALLILLGNLWLAARLAPPPGEGRGTLQSLFDRLNEAAQAAERGQAGGFGRPGRPGGTDRPVAIESEDLPDLTPFAGLVIGGLAIFVALAIAGSIASAWETILLWRNQVPFGEVAGAVTDPVFGRDISYFLFELPFLRLVQTVFNGLVVAGLIVAFARYLVGAMRGGLVFSTPVRIHLGVLGGLFLLSVAFGYQLDKYELVYSTRGVATGVSFTDQNAQFFAYDLLTVLSGLAAALLVAAAFTRMIWPLTATIAVWFLASLVIGRLYPEAVQRFTVQPNQYSQEEAYIGNNIAMTRLAYGLDGWEERAFRGEDILTQEAIDAESDTFRNARLWDYRPLGDTLDQLQTVRRYYDFTDVDTDRYAIDGVQRQVMLSARELALANNPNATGWVNQRIIYTHGIGVAMVPVNEVANEGQPRLFIRNLPPVSDPGAPKIAEPRIYFGERSSDYIIVGAKQAEFDYPTGEGDAVASAGTETRWTGASGIKLDNTLMRLLYAARFRDLDLLISDQVTADSQLLFHRALADRLPRVAPFLRYDKDPYIVIGDDGRLTYIQDAYTTSDRFPHAQGFDPAALDGTRLGSDPFNYIRNSVKITVDAYDGTTRYYISDPEDPIVRAYAKVFPTLFRPIDEMPADLRAHLRFPEEQFNVQTRVFGRYHVTNPLRFYSNDDLWTVPQSQTNEQALPSEAYYVVMRMPGEPEAEFLLLQPMVPTNRPNMIAWIAARNDAPNYGTTRVYRFPSETTIFGPAQIEARIDQDAVISQQITLWRNSGSNVIRGNLIVVPVRDSLIYLQPVYLQSTGSSFPEFRRIVVASPREVVWGESLGEALRLLLEAEAGASPGPGPTPTPAPSPSPGASPTPAPTPGQTPGASPPTGDVAALIDYANLHFELAQQALRDGDFARYGEEMRLVEQALAELDALIPGASASPVP
jgi:uncharacterized membrane protein (UPF0182 family)